MKSLLIEARVTPMVVGNLKRFSLIRKLLPVKTGGTDNARYCYAVWFRHLYYYITKGGKGVPEVVAELGPGDSLGIGLAAILSGANKFYAFDVQHYWNAEKNIEIFDDLVELFMSRSGIPDQNEFKNISPGLASYAFPENILTDDLLKISLNPDRIRVIRAELANPDNPQNIFIKYQIPWCDSSIIQNRSVDFILSQAVLEHVDDLEHAYASMASWLKDDGLISHVIDFKSHGFTKNWNGHWCLSNAEWKIIRGGRIYAINRQPLSVHMNLLEKYGFDVLEKKIKNKETKISRSDLAREFKQLSQDDLCASGVYICACKKSLSRLSRKKSDFLMS